MSEDKKPGLFGRLFGHKTEAKTPPIVPDEDVVGTETSQAPAIAPAIALAPAVEAEEAREVVADLPADYAGATDEPPESPAPSETGEEPAEEEPAPVVVAPPQKRGWLQRLRAGLTRSSGALGGGILSIFTTRKLDAETLEELEDVLIQADLGVAVADRIAERLSRDRYGKDISGAEVKAVLADEIAAILAPVAVPFVVKPDRKPQVVLVVGVNGSGKTTTIGKLAAKFHAEGKSVMMAAGDTFRAAAIDQLKVWAERTGTPIVSRDVGADAAGLAYDALQKAQAENVDILMIDTAGRLQNKAELMAELEKMVRVLRKLDPTAPNDVLLVLDATTGQNALAQAEAFGRTAGVTGLVMTKLDGTARGGILVALSEKYGLPVHFIGVGESVDDLEPFEARDFARAIVGLDG